MEQETKHVSTNLVVVNVRSSPGFRRQDSTLDASWRPYGHFRFVNFGHPPPLVFSTEYRKFMEIGKSGMVQFLPLGLQVAEDDPDRNRYFSLEPQQRQAKSPGVAELTLMSPGDILLLYTDGVYDGSDEQARQQLEAVFRDHYRQSARDICNTVLGYALEQDNYLRQNGDEALIDDKTVFIIKRN